MIPLLEDKILLVSFVLFLFFLFFTFFYKRKSSEEVSLEKDYSELLCSEKYRVK